MATSGGTRPMPLTHLDFGPQLLEHHATGVQCLWSAKPTLPVRSPTSWLRTVHHGEELALSSGLLSTMESRSCLPRRSSFTELGTEASVREQSAVSLEGGGWKLHRPKALEAPLGRRRWLIPTAATRNSTSDSPRPGQFVPMIRGSVNRSSQAICNWGWTNVN